MPEPAELIADGQRYQRAGLLDRARECFRLAADCACDPAQLSEALRRLAAIHRAHCEWDAALEAARLSAEHARRGGLTDLYAEALNAQANIRQSRGEFEDAAALLEQALELDPGDRVRGLALQNLGTIDARNGRLEHAERRYREAYDCFHRAGYAQGEASALVNCGAAVNDRGGHELAEPILRRAINLASDLEDGDLAAIATKNYAEALAGQGRHAEAMYYASSALGFFATAGQHWRQVECFVLVGDISACLGERTAAESCWTQGLELARRIGATPEVAALERRLSSPGGQLAAPPGSR